MVKSLLQTALRNDTLHMEARLGFRQEVAPTDRKGTGSV